MVFQLYKMATSVSTKTLRSSGKFSSKLSFAYLEMYESTLLTHVCTDFTLSRMTMQSQQEKSYSGSESEMKQIRTRTASLLASSASYFLISWQKPSRFFTTTVEYFLEYYKIYSWCQLSEEQKFSRENFRSLLKIRENRESFLTVKLLSFTVYVREIIVLDELFLIDFTLYHHSNTFLFFTLLVPSFIFPYTSVYCSAWIICRN